MAPRFVLAAKLAAVCCAAFLIGCTSINEVSSVDPIEDGFTTDEFNELAKGREGLILLLEQTNPYNGTQIEASADSLYWTDGGGQRKRSSLGDVDHVAIVSNSAGFWEGAYWGGAAGIAGGIALAAADVSGGSVNEQDMAGLAYVGYSVIGGLGGGIVGGIYGSATGHTYHCTFRPKGL